MSRNRIPDFNPNPSKLSDLSMANAQAHTIMLQAEARKKLKQLLDQREEILAAYIAKHGFHPEDTMQVEEIQEDGSHRWFVRQMTDEEKLRIQRKKTKPEEN